jgi:hypothetical protein
MRELGGPRAEGAVQREPQRELVLCSWGLKGFRDACYQ